jgi:chitinase
LFTFQELKEAFKPKQLLLSASLSGYVDKIGETAYNIKELGSLLDFANVMTYDYHGFWDKKTGHHSPIKAQPNDQQQDFNMVSFVFQEDFHNKNVFDY